MAATRSNSIETARRGRELYEQAIRSEVEHQAANMGKLLALDIDSGEYCLATGSMAAVKALKSRRPNARVHVLRVGHPTAVKVGTGPRIAATESRD
jgi:hypothetical protein